MNPIHTALVHLRDLRDLCALRDLRQAALPLAALLLAASASAAEPTGPTEPAGHAVAQASAQSAEEAQRQKQLATWAAERQEIQSKRSMIEQQQLQAETQCYQKFSVESCLNEVRRQARVEDAPLRARELEINAAERKDKAEQRMKSIAEKQAQKEAEKAAVPMQSQRREAAPSGQSGADALAVKAAPRPEVDEQAVQAQRQSEAQQRAAEQAEYVRRHEASRAQAEQGRAEREAKARAEYEAKQLKAQQHKAKVLERAQQGSKAAPLPVPQ